jgi:omega-amidase
MHKSSKSPRVIAGCYQFRVHSGQVKKNLRSVEAALPWFAEQRCQLLVLPEMWSCGFFYEQLAAMAEQTPQVLATLQQWSCSHGMVLVGSLPEAADGVIYNTSYVVDATGEIVGSYRKIHLFSMNREDEHFGRGSQVLVCNTQAGRIATMICYDLRFPELARRLALDGANLLCVSALWPQARIDHWSLLLRARALENQLFVLGCNGSGKDGKTIFGGRSALISPQSTPLAEANDQEQRLLAPLELNELSHFREQIPCLADRVPGAYQIS